MPAKVKTLHITPAAISLEVLLQSRLKLLTARGWEIIGFSTDDESGRRFAAAGFRFIPSHHLSRKFDILADLRFLVECYRVFKQEKPVIVNTYGPKPGLYGRIAARLAGVPIIVHTSWGLYFGEQSPWYGKMAMISLERISASFCDYIFSVNRDDLDLMKQYRFKPASSLGYLGNATDVRGEFNPDRFAPQDLENAREAWKLDPSAIVVGMVGRLTRAKGFKEYFEAAQRIKNQKQYDNVIFVVAGEFDHTKGLGISESEIHRLEEQGVIRYLGYLGQQEMPRLYGIMDIVVLMSHREGFPRCLVEAASMGKPLIATDVRGCREAVEHGVNGYLVRLSDTEALVHYLEQLISHQGLRGQLGRAGRRKALAEFDEVRLVGKILGVYEDLFRSKAAL